MAIEIPKEDSDITIELDDEEDFTLNEEERELYFKTIGEPIPLNPKNSDFDPQNPPTQPLAISERFHAIFVAHTEGFYVAGTKEVIELAKEVKKSGSCIEEICVVDVPIGRVRILALSADSSYLAVCVGHRVHLFSVESLLNKGKRPFFTCSIDESSDVKDFIWRKKLEDSFVVLSKSGKLYKGNVDCPLKEVMENVDAVDWSTNGNYIAVTRKNTLSVMSSKFKRRFSMSLLFKSWISDINPNCIIKDDGSNDFGLLHSFIQEEDEEGGSEARLQALVDSVKWIRRDCIIVGCFQLTKDEEEEDYLVQIITTRDGKITEASSKPVVLSVSGVFTGMVDDSVAYGGGPYMFLNYLEQWGVAVATNRKNSDEHIVLLGWSVDAEKKVAAIIKSNQIDIWFPRVPLQDNGNDSFIAGFGVDKVSSYEKFTVQEDEETKNLSPYCILMCLTLDGKLIIFHMASGTEYPVPSQTESAFSEEEDSPTVESLECDSLKSSSMLDEHKVREITLDAKSQDMNPTDLEVKGAGNPLKGKEPLDSKVGNTTPIPFTQNPLSNTLFSGNLINSEDPLASPPSLIYSSDNVTAKSQDMNHRELEVKGSGGPLKEKEPSNSRVGNTVSFPVSQSSLPNPQFDRELEVKGSGGPLKEKEPSNSRVGNSISFPVSQSSLPNPQFDRELEVKGSGGPLKEKEPFNSRVGNSISFPVSQSSLPNPQFDRELEVKGSGGPLKEKEPSNSRVGNSVSFPVSQSSLPNPQFDRELEVKGSGGPLKEKEPSNSRVGNSVSFPVSQSSLPNPQFDRELEVKRSGGPLKEKEPSNSRVGNTVSFPVSQSSLPNPQFDRNLFNSKDPRAGPPSLFNSSDKASPRGGQIDPRGSIKFDSVPPIRNSQILSHETHTFGTSFNRNVQTMQEKSRNPQSSGALGSEPELSKQFGNASEMVKELDTLLLYIDGEGGFRDVCTISLKDSVATLEDGLENLSERCRALKHTVGERLEETQNLEDKILQVSARKVYMEDIVKQASDSQYWDLWNRQKLNPELELKRRQMLKVNQDLTNQLIDLERHFNTIELNKFGEHNGAAFTRKSSNSGLERSSHNQSLHSLYNTMNSQLAAAEKLSECLSRQMDLLHIESQPVKRQSVAKELFESIGLAYSGDSYSSPDLRKSVCTPDATKKLPFSSCSSIEEPRRNPSSAMKISEPETARRRRDSLDRICTVLIPKSSPTSELHKRLNSKFGFEYRTPYIDGWGPHDDDVFSVQSNGRRKTSSDYEEELRPQLRRKGKGNDIEALTNALSEQTHDVHLKVPEFTEKFGADTFIEWLDKVERIFNYKKYGDPKKVMIIESHLTGFALTWWNSVQQARRTSGYRPISEWWKMRRELKERFIPMNYGEVAFGKL
ncbi:hypothetical protein GIB67_024737 [Kingdonia uniflora]|uniref:Uncharacterized protein n=1 Tax=Kingdonia uniflora TaxID=39325 RepID=A0A7J7NA57_9MAGN|nr:hypothetical protein GIB67_024737 [Kingdonia uniflora]